MKTIEWGKLAHLLTDEDKKLMDLTQTTEVQSARFVLLGLAKVCGEMGMQALQAEKKEFEESLEQ